jgi:hypothetical protein
LKVSVNGNTPSGPNTFVNPTAGSKSAFEPLTSRIIEFEFGCGILDDILIIFSDLDSIPSS